MTCYFVLCDPFQLTWIGLLLLSISLVACLFCLSAPPGLSKNGISYLLRELIVQSGACSQSGQVPRAHSIRGIATSSAFFRNWSLRSVLEAASWRSNTVFTSFYLRDLSFNSDGAHSLGPFVAAGERIG